MKKIKILECIRQGNVGGGESHMLMLTEELDRSQFEPIVLSFTDGPMIEKLASREIRYVLIHSRQAFDLLVVKKIQKLLIEEKIELVHAHGTRACSNVLRAARSLGIPVIYTIHGWSFHPDQSKIIHFLRVFAEKYLVSRTDCNISVSLSNQQTGMDYISGFKSVVINNGIDLDRFNPDKKQINLRVGWGIPQDAKILIFLARFTSHKQPMALLKAFLEVISKCENIFLVMVGDGDQKGEAVSFIRKYDLSKYVRLEPFRDDVPALLSNSDIYILPSLWEGMPIGILEAMAMGKAVIATNVDGTRELIKDMKNGLLIDPSMLEKQLPEKILSLCHNSILFKELSLQAKLSMKGGFDSMSMTKKVQDVYLDVVKKKRN